MFKLIKKIITLFIIITVIVSAYWLYQNVFKSNVHLNGKKFTYIYVKTNATMNDVLDELYNENIIDDHKSFEWTADEMGLTNNLISGKYRISANMSNRSIVKMLKNGKQEKVKLFINSQIRTKQQFVNYITDKLEIDNDELGNYCSNDELLEKKYNLNPDNFMALIAPETYEVNWATHIDELFVMLKNTHDNIWTQDKINKAKAMGYSVSQLITLASITQSESYIKTEQQKIAGVYINRLHQDMKLQADPTVVFANEKFEVQRVLSADLEIDSPYNTYKYKGLPPGPICLVNPSTIDAVLNYTKHSYLFFCAKPNFNGYSNYTNNYTAHQKNAMAYQQALNKKGIKR